jgi:hypothetical protein
MRPKSLPRRLALALAACLALATPACFALFSLDGYGPPADAVDASLDADGSSSASDAADAAPRGRTIFVTSATFTGDLGTRDGGDSKCQATAIDAGLSGSYRVWLSETGGGVLEQLVGDAGPLRLVNGVLVASDTSDLARAGPRTGIVLDERGRKLGGGGCEDGGLVAWTGTAADGAAPESFGQDCSHWRSSGNQPGLVGLVGGAGATWTAACTRSCNQQAALYCIQQ